MSAWQWVGGETRIRWWSGGKACTLCQERWICASSSEWWWNAHERTGGSLTEIFTYSRFLTDEGETIQGCFRKLSSTGSNICPRKPTWQKQKAPHKEWGGRNRVCVCVCDLDLAVTYECVCKREGERGKRYREIVQADWLMWKWVGAEWANRVRDRQSKEEMVTKGQIFF